MFHVPCSEKDLTAGFVCTMSASIMVVIRDEDEYKTGLAPGEPIQPCSNGYPCPLPSALPSYLHIFAPIPHPDPIPLSPPSYPPPPPPPPSNPPSPTPNQVPIAPQLPPPVLIAPSSPLLSSSPLPSPPSSPSMNAQRMPCSEIATLNTEICTQCCRLASRYHGVRKVTF